MAKTHFILCPGIGAKNSIVVDGHELRGMTRSVRVSMTAGGVPEVEIDIFATECVIEADGIVRLCDTAIPDDLARDFYNTLKKRFDR